MLTGGRAGILGVDSFRGRSPQLFLTAQSFTQGRSLQCDHVASFSALPLAIPFRSKPGAKESSNGSNSLSLTAIVRFNETFQSRLMGLDLAIRRTDASSKHPVQGSRQSANDYAVGVSPKYSRTQSPAAEAGPDSLAKLKDGTQGPTIQVRSAIDNLQNVPSAARFRDFNDSAVPLTNKRPIVNCRKRPRQPGGNWKFQLNVTRHAAVLSTVIWTCS